MKSKRKTPRQRVIGAREGRVRAERLIKANRKLFQRLAGPSRAGLTCADLAGDLIGSFRGGPPDASTNKRYLEEAILADHLKHAASSTIKRTVKGYGRTLRRPAKGPRRAKRA